MVGHSCYYDCRHIYVGQAINSERRTIASIWMMSDRHRQFWHRRVFFRCSCKYMHDWAATACCACYLQNERELRVNLKASIHLVVSVSTLSTEVCASNILNWRKYPWLIRFFSIQICTHRSCNTPFEKTGCSSTVWCFNLCTFHNCLFYPWNSLGFFLFRWNHPKLPFLVH